MKYRKIDIDTIIQDVFHITPALITPEERITMLCVLNAFYKVLGSLDKRISTLDISWSIRAPTEIDFILAYDTEGWDSYKANLSNYNILVGFDYKTDMQAGVWMFMTARASTVYTSWPSGATRTILFSDDPDTIETKLLEYILEFWSRS